MKIFYLRHHLNKTGEDAKVKFNRPSLKTVLKNLDDLEDELPVSASSFIDYFESINNLHIMCVEEKLSNNYQETIENFKQAFIVIYQELDLRQTLKSHVIFYHYSDYFAMNGKNLRETNAEHHEALHHKLKTMEGDRNIYVKRNHGGVVHQQKSHKSISIRNALSAGFTPKAKLRIRKCFTSSSSSPKSSPRKGLFNHSKSFLTNFHQLV